MFNNYIGQEHIKQNLKVAIESSKIKNKKLDHILLVGPGGLGKSTLSRLIATEINTKFIEIISHNLNNKFIENLAYTYSNENLVLFIDELHAVQPKIEEILYSVFDKGTLSLNKMFKFEGVEMPSIQTVNFKNLTIIGATTNISLLSKPFLSRFTYTFNLQPYSIEELKQIAGIHVESNEEDLLHEIAIRSRSNARLAVQIARQVNNWITVNKECDKEDIFKAIGVDKEGLNQNDYRILGILRNGPRSLEALSSILGEPKETLQKNYEPYLLEKGFIEITSAGRELTEKGYRCLIL